MIHRYVDVNFDGSYGSTSKRQTSRTITLFYPCNDTKQCAPYTLNLKPAVYSFECWGAKGTSWGSSKPGLGAYTKGTIYISAETTLFVFVGATGRIKSNIKTVSAVIEGIIIGNIEAKNRVMLMPTSRVLGEIRTPELIIQNGVILEGLCIVAPDPLTNPKETILSLYNNGSENNNN